MPIININVAVINVRRVALHVHILNWPTCRIVHINGWASNICNFWALICLIVSVFVAMINALISLVGLVVLSLERRMLWDSAVIVVIKSLKYFLRSFVSLEPLVLVGIWRHALVLFVAIVRYVSVVLPLKLLSINPSWIMQFVIIWTPLMKSGQIVVGTVFWEALLCLSHLHIFLKLLCESPPLFFINLIQSLLQQRAFNFLMVSPSKLLNCLMLIPYAFTNFGSRRGPFDINGIEIPAVTFIHGDSVFKGIPFRGVEYLIFFDLIFGNFFLEYSFSGLQRIMLFTLWNFWGELFFFAIIHRGV